jgi:uncharacterized membrane protein
MSRKTEARRTGHVLWALVNALAACGFLYGAIACVNEYQLQESTLGKAIQLANGTTNANLYLAGVVGCLIAVGLLVWNAAYHFRTAGRVD